MQKWWAKTAYFTYNPNGIKKETAMPLIIDFIKANPRWRVPLYKHTNTYKFHENCFFFHHRFFFHCSSLRKMAEPMIKKAQKYFDLAKEDCRWQRWEVAEEKLLASIERDDQYLDAMNLLAEVYVYLQDFEQSKTWTKKIIDIDDTYSPNLLLILATLEHQGANYNEALPYYERYLKIAPPESSNYRTAKLGAASCEYANWAMEHPVEFKIENLSETVNTEYDEYFPALTADEALLMFTRALPMDRGSYFPGSRKEDFFFSDAFEDGSWDLAYNPGPPLNTPLNEGAPTLSPDGKYLIFTACDLGDYGSYGPDKQGYGSCDLFVSVRQGNKWLKPVNMGPTINSKHWETQPSFASDGQTIYFIRGKYDRAGVRHTDIYKTQMINGKWSKATALPPNINSEGQEESVFIHPDIRPCTSHRMDGLD